MYRKQHVNPSEPVKNATSLGSIVRTGVRRPGFYAALVFVASCYLFHEATFKGDPFVTAYAGLTYAGTLVMYGLLADRRMNPLLVEFEVHPVLPGKMSTPVKSSLEGQGN